MNELRFRIVLQEPPAGVDFGLQLGRSAASTITQLRRSVGEDMSFEFALGIVTVAGSDLVDFRGAACQGPKGERFVYICSGQSAGQFHSPWTRRLKVPLTGITTELVQKASKALLECRVPGSGRDGGPSAATVKPFGGWAVGSTSLS
jgi:hypothetical protein